MGTELPAVRVLRSPLFGSLQPERFERADPPAV